MDLKDSKTQKIVLGVLAFFIVGYFWYSRLYSRQDAEIEAKSLEFETITSNLRSVEMKAKSLDALREEYNGLLDRYHEIEALLPEVKQIPSFLVQLHTASSITGTKITKLTPIPNESEDFYNVASFELEMSGTYHDFATFVSYVANFPFIANMSDMNIAATKLAISEADAKSTDLSELKKRETLKATFTLSTFFVKEDERLAELDF